jgi:hypothetical protein
MSRKGNCWDNAVAESFFSSLKKERIKKHIYKNRELALSDLAAYIESFYNPTRRHSYLGGVSPVEFEAAHEERERRLHSRLGTPLSLRRLCFRGVGTERAMAFGTISRPGNDVAAVRRPALSPGTHRATLGRVRKPTGSGVPARRHTGTPCSDASLDRLPLCRSR